MRTSLPKILDKIMEKDDRYVLLIGDIGHYLFKDIEKKYDVLDLKVQLNGAESILEERNENIIY